MWAVAYGLWSDGPDGDPAKLADDVSTTISQAKSRQGVRPKTATVPARSVELGEPAEPKRAARHDQASRTLDGSAPADADSTDCFDENGGFDDFAD